MNEATPRQRPQSQFKVGDTVIYANESLPELMPSNPWAPRWKELEAVAKEHDGQLAEVVGLHDDHLTDQLHFNVGLVFADGTRFMACEHECKTAGGPASDSPIEPHVREIDWEATQPGLTLCVCGTLAYPSKYHFDSEADVEAARLDPDNPHHGTCVNRKGVEGVGFEDCECNCHHDVIDNKPTCVCGHGEGSHYVIGCNECDAMGAECKMFDQAMAWDQLHRLVLWLNAEYGGNISGSSLVASMDSIADEHGLTSTFADTKPHEGDEALNEREFDRLLERSSLAHDNLYGHCPRCNKEQARDPYAKQQCVVCGTKLDNKPDSAKPRPCKVCGAHWYYDDESHECEPPTNIKPYSDSE